MSAAPSIRPLARIDLPELVNLCREHAEYERSAWMEFDRIPKFEKLLLHTPNWHCWVVEDRGELAGFTSVSTVVSTWDAETYLDMDCLYLRETYRGRGLGKKLIEQVSALAIELEVVNVQWQTPDWNESAARFYRRLGATQENKLRFKLSSLACRALLEE